METDNKQIHKTVQQISVLWRKIKQGVGVGNTGRGLLISVRLSEDFLRRWQLGRDLKEVGWGGG